MSLPRRLWRLARQSLRSIPSIPSDDYGARGADRDAERELEEFLGAASQADVAPPPPPHPLAQHYSTLGLSMGADAATVERAWRRLVLQNHPDRYAADPAAERAASERLRHINQAHEEILRWQREHGVV